MYGICLIYRDEFEKDGLSLLKHYPVSINYNTKYGLKIVTSLQCKEYIFRERA